MPRVSRISFRVSKATTSFPVALAYALRQNIAGQGLPMYYPDSIVEMERLGTGFLV